MAHVADLLAAGAGKAMGDVTDLSAALNQSAMVANATGLSIEETTAGLAAFASQGLLGSDAGTSFKSMLQSLTPTSKEAAEEMSRLGISAYDSQGNFIGLAEFAGRLRAGLKDLTVEQQQAALKTIFGSDAIRAATVLYSEGEKGIRKWIQAVDDQGYASETAAARLDNLKGDVEALGGALDTALIKTGSEANDALRGLVQGLTAAIDAYTNLDPALQSAAMVTGIFVSATALVAGGVLLAVPKIAEFRNALKELNITAESTTTTLGKVAPAALAIAAVPIAADLTDWIRSFRDVTTASAELERSLRKAGDVTTELTRGLAAGNPLAALNPDQIALSNLQQLNTLIGDLAANYENSALGKAMSLPYFGASTGIGEAKRQIEEIDTALASLVAAGNTEAASAGFEQFAAKAEQAGWSQEKIASMLPQYVAAQGDATSAALEAAEAAESESGALDGLADAAEITEQAIAELSDMIKNFGSAQFDVERSAIAFNDSFARLQENIDAGTASLDIATESGRETGIVLLETAQATNDYAAAVQATGGSTEQVQGILESGRQKIVETRMALGDSEQAARAYADRLVATPDAISTQVQLTGAAAAEQMLDSLARTRTATINVGIGPVQGMLDTFASLGSANGNIVAYANGGISTGIYAGGAPIHKFAEPETGWEAYISGKPSERDRNRQIWVESGERLGIMQEIRAALAASGARESVNLTQQIYPQPGMSEVEIGNIAAAKIGNRLRGRL